MAPKITTSEFERGFTAGWDAAMRQAAPRKKERASRGNGPKKQEDELISEFVESKSIVFCADIIGFIGIDDNRGNRIAVGNSMKRLGWIRCREAPPSRRWYYERGIISNSN